MHRSRSGAYALGLMLLTLLAACGRGEPSGDTGGSMVIAIGDDPDAPIPTLPLNGADLEVEDLLFLRLADIGPGLNTLGDSGFVPRLARRWERRDSVTIAFTIDSRARWHDGTPVTAGDVAFTFERARSTNPQLATALHRVASVTAENDSTAVFRFVGAYPEQMYDATYQLLPLPAHLLRHVAPDSLATSDYARAPVGDGPYRWVRHVPDQLLELQAVDSFYLGRPALRRVIFRVAKDHEAMLNLVLSGEADAAENLTVSDLPRVEADSQLRVAAVPSSYLTYMLFNQRARRDRRRPHPILADSMVRRALVLALDRPLMAEAVYGGYATVPTGPLPQTLSWAADPARSVEPSDTGAARALLAQAGWMDHDGDGILDKSGRPLELTANIPAQSTTRVQLAQQIQQRLRGLGIKINLSTVDFPVFVARRNAGDFDLDFGAANMDPTPSGLQNSWTCATAGKADQNVASYCDQAVDSLLARAGSAAGGTLGLYRAAVTRIDQDRPAAFLAAPATLVAVHRRFQDVSFSPLSLWSEIWRWKVKPGAQLRRDGSGTP